jgi:predicted HTH transcriptional regulator
LSPDKKRLSEHLSAFANLPGGGFLVFGVNNAGKGVGVDEAVIETTIRKRSCGKCWANAIT